MQSGVRGANDRGVPSAAKRRRVTTSASETGAGCKDAPSLTAAKSAVPGIEGDELERRLGEYEKLEGGDSDEDSMDGDSMLKRLAEYNGRDSQIIPDPSVKLPPSISARLTRQGVSPDVIELIRLKMTVHHALKTNHPTAQSCRGCGNTRKNFNGHFVCFAGWCEDVLGVKVWELLSSCKQGQECPKCSSNEGTKHDCALRLASDKSRFMLPGTTPTPRKPMGNQCKCVAHFARLALQEFEQIELKKKNADSAHNTVGASQQNRRDANSGPTCSGKTTTANAAALVTALLTVTFPEAVLNGEYTFGGVRWGGGGSASTRLAAVTADSMKLVMRHPKAELSTNVQRDRRREHPLPTLADLDGAGQLVLQMNHTSQDNESKANHRDLFRQQVWLNPDNLEFLAEFRLRFCPELPFFDTATLKILDDSNFDALRKLGWNVNGDAGGGAGLVNTLMPRYNSAKMKGGALPLNWYLADTDAACHAESVVGSSPAAAVGASAAVKTPATSVPVSAASNLVDLSSTPSSEISKSPQSDESMATCSDEQLLNMLESIKAISGGEGKDVLRQLFVMLPKAECVLDTLSRRHSVLEETHRQKQEALDDATRKVLQSIERKNAATKLFKEIEDERKRLIQSAAHQDQLQEQRQQTLQQQSLAREQLQLSHQQPTRRELIVSQQSRQQQQMQHSNGNGLRILQSTVAALPAHASHSVQPRRAQSVNQMHRNFPPVHSEQNPRGPHSAPYHSYPRREGQTQHYGSVYGYTGQQQGREVHPRTYQRHESARSQSYGAHSAAQQNGFRHHGRNSAPLNQQHHNHYYRNLPPPRQRPPNTYYNPYGW